MRLIFFALYLGFGAILHSLFIGPHFNWSSSVTVEWLFAWPIMLMIYAWFLFFVIGIIGVICWALYSWGMMIAEWRDGRRKAKARRAA